MASDLFENSASVNIIFPPTKSLCLEESPIFDFPEAQKYGLLEIKIQQLSSSVYEVRIYIANKLFSSFSGNYGPFTFGHSFTSPIYVPAYDIQGNSATLNNIEVNVLGPHTFDYSLFFDNGQRLWIRSETGTAKPPLTICHPDEYMTPAMKVLYGK